MLLRSAGIVWDSAREVAFTSIARHLAAERPTLGRGARCFWADGRPLGSCRWLVPGRMVGKSRIWFAGIVRGGKGRE